MDPLLDQSPVALVCLDSNDRITALNRAARNMGLAEGSAMTSFVPGLEEKFVDHVRFGPASRIYHVVTAEKEKPFRVVVNADESSAGDTTWVWFVDVSEQLALGEQLRTLKRPGLARHRQANQLAVTALGYAELLDVILTESEMLSSEKLGTVRHYQQEVSKSLKAIQKVLSGEETPVTNSTVLVADRHPALAALIEELLRAEGYKVVSFTDAGSALKYCRVNEHAIQTAVVDDSLRDDQNERLIDALIAVAPGLGIVPLTDDPAGQAGGAVQKPIDFRVLLDSLSSVSPPPGKA